MAKIESDSEVELFRVFEDKKDEIQEIFRDITFADSDRILYIFRILHLALHSGEYKEMVENTIS